MKNLYIAFLLVLFTNVLFAATASEGKTGLSFLKVGVDARAVGMGEAYTALSEDASATFWNPAGLVNAAHSNVLFNHNAWIEGINGEFAAIAFVKIKSAWGFHIRSFNIGDIQVRGDSPTAEPLDNTSAHYLSAGLSYARRLNPSLNFGVTLKYLFEKIYVESATGYAVDLGLTYRLPFPNMRLGAVIQNLGKMNTLRAEETKLPVIGRVGLLYRLPVTSNIFSINLAADAVKPSEENIRFHLGGELVLWKQIAIRSGFLQGYDARDFSFGVGVMRSSIRFDYALTPFTENLGVAHRFTVNFNL
jgi:hypothetical protein